MSGYASALGGGAADGGVALSAGAASQSTGTVIFSNANGVTFGLNAGTMTASVGAAAPGSISAGTTRVALGEAVFADSNGVSFGVNGSTVTATVQTNYLTTAMASNRGSDFVAATAAFAGTSASGTIASNGISVSIGPYLTTAALSNHSHGASGNNGSFAFQTLSFSNVNGISFGTSAGPAITASYTVPTVPAQLSVGDSNLGNTAGDTGVFTGRVVLVGSNNITLSGSSNGGSATLSFIGGAGGGGAALGVSNTGHTAGNTGTYSSGTIVFAGSSSLTLSQSTGGGGVHTIWLQPAMSQLTAGANISLSSNGSTITISGLAQSLTAYATGNTTLSSTGTSNLSSLVFRGSGAASVGITNGSILIDVAAGAAAITQSIGISTQTAGGATAGTSGYATGDDVLYHFVPGSNITMSQSVNGASATLSIYGPAAAGGVTYSGLDPFNNAELVSHAGANASLYLQHTALPSVQFNRVGLWITHSNATNSSGSLTLSAWIGIYTRNASSLSLVSSTSATIPYTASGTAGSYSQFGGIKIWAVPWTVTLAPNNYWIGRVTRSTTGGANMTIGAMGLSNVASTWSGYLGSASNATNHRFIGQGVYSATTAGMPSAISLTQVQANSSIMHRQPAFAFMSDIF